MLYNTIRRGWVLEQVNKELVVAATVKYNGGNIFDLWHKRLEHPFPRVMELIPKTGYSRSNALSNKACDVCLRAKQ